MASERRRYYSRGKDRSSRINTENSEYEYYIDGNTVRQTAVPQWSPVEEPAEPERQQPRAPKKRPRSRQERALEHAKLLNLPSIAVMTVCMVMAGFSLFNYVSAKADLDIHIRSVKTLTEQLQDQKQQNDARMLEIQASINYAEIFDYATETLGMTFPGKEQVMWYSSTESEYVSQYESIPQK